jgi:hypothetical protein
MVFHKNEGDQIIQKNGISIMKQKRKSQSLENQTLKMMLKYLNLKFEKTMNLNMNKISLMKKIHPNLKMNIPHPKLILT